MSYSKQLRSMLLHHVLPSGAFITMPKLATAGAEIHMLCVCHPYKGLVSFCLRS